jgi:hypothetical protein
MRHEFPIPNKPLNSTKFRDETGFDLYIADDQLIVSGECTKAQAQAALTAHDGTTPEPTVAEKLASVGLSLDDLKAALGV